MAEKSLESRVVAIEGDVAHIKEDIKDMKIDIRNMQAQVKAINDGLAVIQREVGVLTATIPHLATKAELQALEAHIIKWFVGTAVAIAALVFGIARFVALPVASATGIGGSAG